MRAGYDLSRDLLPRRELRLTLEEIDAEVLQPYLQRCRHNGLACLTAWVDAHGRPAPSADTVDVLAEVARLLATKFASASYESFGALEHHKLAAHALLVEALQTTQD